MESEDHINREPEAPTGPGPTDAPEDPGPTEQEAEQDLPPGYADREGDEAGEGQSE